jgi:hypothetical protein
LPPPQVQLDTRALEIASQSLGKIEVHERECGARWQEVRDLLKKVVGCLLVGLLLIVGSGGGYFVVKLVEGYRLVAPP